MKIDCIVAHDEQQGIGRNNDIPWHCPPDMTFFKTLTTATNDPKKQNIVIMGRQTWDSIPERFRPLPGRINIVLSRQLLELPNGVYVRHSIESVLQCAAQLHEEGKAERVFCIGGAQLYQQMIENGICESLYVTEMLQTFDCDRFFPSYTENFRCVDCSEIQEYKDLRFRFKTFEEI